MGNSNFLGAILVVLLAVDAYTAAATPIYSARLIHRLSGEAQKFWGSKVKNEETTSWPEKKSFGHMRLLLENDLKRQRLKLGTQNQPLIAAQGGQTQNYGNDMGWLHYMWVDIGTPNSSFLVALDTGSDMFWVPCDCIACAPLLEKDLAEYSPSHSNTSKLIPCSHELCERGSLCESPKGHCPYLANYRSEDTSSSGFLFEDLFHLATIGETKRQSSVHASIIIGCGSKQTGEYLEGSAPDGVMGLGPGDISVPSMLAKSGVVPHSYSFCYDKSYSGSFYFGDQGPASQLSTSLLPLKESRNIYVVEVDHYCVGNSCLKQTGYQAQVDTGSSFTYLPSESYEQVVSEFHRQANTTRVISGFFDNCFDARSLDISNIPKLKLVFPMNQSFLIENLIMHVIDQGSFYCLGMHQTDGDIGIIGQNFLMGYHMVFDWEKLKLGWSISNCDDVGAKGEISHVAPPPTNISPNPLPTNQQQRSPHAHAVAPALAGRAPKPSGARPLFVLYQYYCIMSLSLFLWTAYIIYMI
ncbi:hypothetical protein ACS0TY_013355 [Phlomoides rotata]